MRRVVAGRMLCAAAAALALAWPSAALAAQAATGTVTAPAAPVALGTIDAQLWPGEAQGAMVLVGLTLPDSVKLPATVRIPVPAGATVDWAGEIVGPTPDKDIQREYTVVDGKGGRYIEFQLTTSHVAQYEAAFTTPEARDGMLVSTMEWVQSTEAANLQLTVRASTRMANVTVEPKPQEAPEFNKAGERMYLVTFVAAPEVGSKNSVTVTFDYGEESGAGGAGTSSTRDTVLIIAGVSLGIALLGLVVVLRMQASRRRT